MPSSGMVLHLALARTVVSEEHSAFIIRIRINEIGTSLAATSNRLTLIVFIRSMRRLLVMAKVPSSPILVTLIMEALRFPKRPFLQEPHGAASKKTAFFMSNNRIYFRKVLIFQVFMAKFT
jgi:hypothetical protein